MLGHEFLLNDRWSLQDQQGHLEKLEKFLEGYSFQEPKLILLTSGTSSSARWVVLDRVGFQIAAKAFNAFFSLTANDIWMLCLPKFHVAGRAIIERASSVKAPVVECLLWDPAFAYKMLKEYHVSVCSIVPTQLYDFVQAGYQAPADLRYLFVGGGGIRDDLWQQALDLKWPVCQTYAMTEAGSTVGVRRARLDPYRVLTHLMWEKSPLGTLSIKGPSILDGYLTMQDHGLTWSDPKEQGWYITHDYINLYDDGFMLLSRVDRVVKILGENVFLDALQAELQKRCHATALTALEDPRRGHYLVAAVEPLCYSEIRSTLKDYNRQVLPFERIEHIVKMDHIPRTELHKIQHNKVLEYVSKHQERIVRL